MLAALVLLLATATATPEEIDHWVRDLDASSTARRENAVQRLLASGDDAAYALEVAEFRTAGGAFLAQDLLNALRQPTAVLRPPPFVGREQKKVVLELIVSNARPTPLHIEPLYGRLKRGKGVKRNPRWSFSMPKGVGGPHVARDALLRGYVIPARSDLAIPFGFIDHVQGRESFRIGVSYRGGSFQLTARATVRVGQESLTMLRSRAYSSREELRSEAVAYLRYRLRVDKPDKPFVRTLRLVSRSPYRDTRRDVARALGDYGISASRTHTEILTALANDRDLSVSREAFLALAKRGKFSKPPPELRRLASRLFARPADLRRRYLYDMLAGLTPRTRRQFLASVLAKSRTRGVHVSIAALLRQEGLPVEPTGSGLIPRSQIVKLGR